MGAAVSSSRTMNSSSLPAAVLQMRLGMVTPAMSRGSNSAEKSVVQAV